MSLFREISVRCPSCGALVRTEAVHSVNADRRPDLREEILGHAFQLTTCSKCETTFRLDPDLTLLDVGRGQWIAVRPFGHLRQWEAEEAEAQKAFDMSYGPRAAPAAQALGSGITPRLVFGWAALREKILARELGLDDLVLEQTKMASLTAGHPSPITARTELRLVDGTDNELILSWIVAESGAVQETLGVPRALYDEIANDADSWSTLRSEFENRLFVDMQRLMLASAPMDA